jgi:UDP-N-acetylmuramyl pentapeptide phosphotransferase/UDP-N-acetylglucosamine-1-phosphate transferase
MLLPLIAVGASALLSAGLIVLLRPLLVRYALARPNARSSHKAPTPQGGGIAVIAATLLVATAALALVGQLQVSVSVWVAVAGSSILLAIIGAIDDMRPLPELVRLISQALAVVIVVAVAGNGARVLPEAIPLWLELGLAVLAGLWFVNLVNFMDGIDWITVAEMVPIAAALLLFGLAGIGPSELVLPAAALLGALLGFAPFNKPVARLFLGDVGSLPIGLLVAWMLYVLAGAGGLAAALILPLYYLADATLTLLRRLARGERIWEAHRTHFYQQATDKVGFSVMEVAANVFGLNLALAALAAVALLWPMPIIQFASLALAAALVGVVLFRFAVPRSKRAPA